MRATPTVVFLNTGGLWEAGGTHNFRRSARLLSEHFVAHDECRKNTTSPRRVVGVWGRRGAGRSQDATEKT